jgi:hypothetical protein
MKIATEIFGREHLNVSGELQNEIFKRYNSYPYFFDALIKVRDIIRHSDYEEGAEIIQIINTALTVRFDGIYTEITNKL